jgi:hypothetical protein
VTVSRAAAAVALTAAAVGCVYAFHWPDPFRPGLLSALLYVAPVIVAGVAIRRTAKSRTARGVRRVLAEGLAILTALLVLAIPFGFLQRNLAPAVWFTGSGVPSRAWTQVITVPGMAQEAYQWNARQRQLTAYFDAPAGMAESWAAVETVRSGSSSPCATVDYPDGDAAPTKPARCTRAARGLWTLTPRDRSSVGFIRRTDGVTITLTGFRADRSLLRRAILSARPGSNADLWTRINSIPARATLIFL